MQQSGPPNIAEKMSKCQILLQLLHFRLNSAPMFSACGPTSQRSRYMQTGVNKCQRNIFTVASTLDTILEESVLKLTCKELAALEFSVALGGGWNCGEEDNSIMTSCILKTNLKASVSCGCEGHCVISSGKCTFIHTWNGLLEQHQHVPLWCQSANKFKSYVLASFVRYSTSTADLALSAYPSEIRHVRACSLFN